MQSVGADSSLLLKVSAEAGSLTDEGKRQMLTFVAGKIRQHQVQHLVDRVAKVPRQTLPRLFIAAVDPALMHQLLNERLHLSGEISPGFGPTVLRIAGKMHQCWHPAEYVALCVTVLMQPGDVALDWFAEPGGSDTVTCLWFEEIMFNHNNGLSQTRETRQVPIDAKQNYVPSETGRHLRLGSFGGLRPHNAAGHKKWT